MTVRAHETTSVRTAGAGRRRCRSPRAIAPGELRPTDVVGAFFVCGIAFFAAAALAGVVNALEPWAHGRWLALHLAFVGGVSQLVIGAGQFFAGAFLATNPPRRRLVRIQLGSWNAGAVTLAVAMPIGSDVLVWASVAMLLAALAAYGVALYEMHRDSLRHGVWASWAYVAGAALFALGIVAGGALSVGAGWSGGHLLGAHMALNLGGWFGTAIVATLHTFYPSLTGTTLRFPRLEPWTLAAWIGGIGALAIGYAWSVEPLALAGWLALCASASLVVTNVAGCTLAGARPLSLPARFVGLAQPFLLAGLALATVAALEHGALDAIYGTTRSALAILLVAGWIGLTVLGSLAHLLAVVVRVRDFSRPIPVARPSREIPVAVLAAAGVVSLAASRKAGVDGLEAAGAVALLAAYGFLAARVVSLATQVIRIARPSV